MSYGSTMRRQMVARMGQLGLVSAAQRLAEIRRLQELRGTLGPLASDALQATGRTAAQRFARFDQLLRRGAPADVLQREAALFNDAMARELRNASYDHQRFNIWFGEAATPRPMQHAGFIQFTDPQAAQTFMYTLTPWGGVRGPRVNSNLDIIGQAQWPITHNSYFGIGEEGLPIPRVIFAWGPVLATGPVV